MLTAVTAIVLPYAACVALYHAHPKRSAIARVRSDPRASGILRAVAAALFAWAVLVLAAARGWELGIPIFLGILCGAGILTVLGATFTPRLQVASGAALGAAGALAGLVALL